MKRRKIIAIAIAVALQPWYTPAFASDNNDDNEDCPKNISLLSKEERKKLSAACLAALPENDNHWGWVTGGVAALVASVAIGIDNNGGGHARHQDTSPLPPDDNVTPIPPDDGGDDVTPPDDGGDDVTPPDDGGDVTPPDTRVNIYDNGVTSDHGAATVTLDELNINTAATSATNVVLSWQKSTDGNSYILTAADGTQLVADKWHITDDNNAVFSGTTSDGRFWKYDSRGNLIVASKGTLITDQDGATHTSERGLVISGENETGVIISGDNTQNTLNGNSTVSDGAIGIIVTGDNTINTISGQSTTDGATGAFISGNGTTTNISGGIDVTDGGTGLVIDGDDITIDNTGISDISGEGSTGSVINGNNARVVNEGEMTITDGGTGGHITGDNAFIENKGNSTVSGEGSSALNISGDDATVISEGAQYISDGATGTHINGNDATVNMTGDITVNNGAIAMIIDGDNSSVNITGTSDISGQGSIGTIINGDKAHITNDGELNVADGGTGAKITGNDTVVDNTGDVTASGTGSTALYIEGDDTQVISQGQQTITDGATGTRINGDSTRITNTGDITADGAGSIAAVIDGNDSSLIQTGDLLVTHGATGLVAYGQNNTLSNTGNATVQDTSSIGFVVAGQGNTFKNKGNIQVSLNGTGTLVSGNEAQTTLGGNIIVDSTQDSTGVYRGATGISIIGDDTTTDISGSVSLNSDFANNSKMASSDVLSGIDITGDNNQVSLSGALTIYSSDQTSNDSGGYLNSIGLNITGDGNNVDLMGGINIDQSAVPGMYSSLVTGININGESNVTLDGHSQLKIKDISGGSTALVNVANGGEVIFNDTSVVDIQYNFIDSQYFSLNAIMAAGGTNSSIENQGAINMSGITTLMRASNGASVKNSGDIKATTNTTKYNMIATLEADGKNSTAVNAAGGSITLTTGSTPYGEGGILLYPIAWYSNTVYGMLAYNNAAVFNDAGAEISLYGAGLYGMTASKGTALNAGSIYVDGFKQTLDADGNIISESYWAPSDRRVSSSGMVAGSSNSGSGSATVTNTGTITVHNAGFGMSALSGGTAINQGTINLTSDENVGTETPLLVGMAATAGGTAINSATGVINIDASYGQAFYADGSSYIINNGQINLNGSPMDDQDTHMGSTPGDQLWLQVLAGSGDSDTQTSASGFISVTPLANYGNETLNGNVDAKSWLYNEADAALTVDGTLSINAGGLENKGTLNADKIKANATTYNRAGGSITTDLLTLGGNTTFFNDGDFTGAISASSYQQEIVNNGGMTVTEDGKALMSGSFLLYNDAGATLSNSGSAVAGGENTIVHVTRTSDSLSQVNSGTITATNGYSAITTASTDSNSNGKWIWNTETGVINGINPNAPLINLGRGYNFANQGTINVQGNNAVAISGGSTSYIVNLVNSGTINVGTEQGQIDDTNGTGLIGIKGNGSKTTINNTADGVINVYADNSYAFGGTTKAIINNGEINLLCDSGCGIYAPGTTYTNEDGAADIAIPDADTAPSQGNIPTPPADPNAPQQLSNYIVGTNADGSSGTLKANNLVIGDNVKVGTGFTAGTADTTIVVDNAFTGSNIQGAENIGSTSVVWNAQGSTDTDGNVDVTMTKNAYTDVATDSSVDSVAQALDAGYTNNELYTSLNVGTTAELNRALKQVSGSQATTVFREARVLSNRFNMLTSAAPQVNANGLAFNVVAKGDPRAELGNDTEYDMLALRQTLDLTTSQNLTMEYGIARLDGSGSQKVGDNGLTGGFSQFFGLKHSMAFEDGLAWNNALRYDVHNLDSNRSVSYGDVSKVADSSTRQQYLEFRSEGAKTFTLMRGCRSRHTQE